MNIHTVVLGAGYAGTLAALRLGRHAGPVTLVNSHPFFSERIRFHQLATGQNLPVIPFARLLRGTDINFVCGRATAIDLRDRHLDIETAEGAKRLPFERLIYALGSQAAPGLEGTVPIANREGAALLRERLPKVAAEGGRVAVIGAGLTGIEIATEVSDTFRDLEVHLISSDGLGRSLSAVGRAALRDSLTRLGIRVTEHARVSGAGPCWVELAAASSSNVTWRSGQVRSLPRRSHTRQALPPKLEVG